MKVRILILCSVALILMGCKTYTAEDDSQLYVKIVDGVGHRLSTQQPEFCISDLQEYGLIDCINLVPNPYLFGDFIVPSEQDYVSIYRDIDGYVHMRFAGGSDGKLVFVTLDKFYLVIGEEVILMKIKVDKDGGYIEVDNRRFDMYRIELE